LAIKSLQGGAACAAQCGSIRHGTNHAGTLQMKAGRTSSKGDKGLGRPRQALAAEGVREIDPTMLSNAYSGQQCDD
jgi:hypothetical protein